MSEKKVSEDIDILSESVDKWVNNVFSDTIEEGYEYLIKTFGRADVICKFAENYQFQSIRVAEKFMHIHSIDYCAEKHEKETLNIAAYYRNIKNGGAQRVVAKLCNIWSEMKNENGNPLYNVILLTDTGPLDDEYPVNKNIIREYLPDFEKCSGKNYRERFNALDDIITKYDIDIVINSMWVSPLELWDMLCVKSHEKNPAFIIHSHNFCGVPFRFMSNEAAELMYIYQLCDGVVTLSECDRKYVSTFCKNTRCIVNPMELHPKSDYRESDEKILLWLSRVSKEKNPLDVIYMMNYVTEEVPDAKLYMVGDGDDDIINEAHSLVKQLGLEDNIIFTGFTLDVDEYYKKASVFIMTSDFEGFSLTLGEALDVSLPVVAYDLPNITFMRDGRGIVSVEPHRPDLLAKEAVRILKDEKFRKELGNSGRELFEELCSVDIGQEWKMVFDNIKSKPGYKEIKETDEILFKYLTISQGIGILKWREKLQETYDEKSKINCKLQQTYAEKAERDLEIKRLKGEINHLKEENENLRKSKTYRIGKIITWLPGRIKRMFSGGRIK